MASRMRLTPRVKQGKAGNWWIVLDDDDTGRGVFVSTAPGYESEADALAAVIALRTAIIGEKPQRSWWPWS